MIYYINRRQEIMKKFILMMVLFFLGNTLILSQDLVKAAQSFSVLSAVNGG